MLSSRSWMSAALVSASLLFSHSCVAQDLPVGSLLPVALSTIDQTQVELTAEMIDRYIEAEHELFHTPGLPSSPTSAPAKRPLFDALAIRHGFPDFKVLEIVENNIGFVMAGTDPDTRKYIGRDAVIAGLVADVEKDASVPASVKATRISIIQSMKDDSPDRLIASNIPLVSRNYDRIIRSIKGED